MTETTSLSSRVGAPNRLPVTDPVRVFLVDLDVAAAGLLSRAVDMDRELAVVGVCRNPKRVRREADHCQPDLIAIRLDMDDPRCLAVLGELVEVAGQPCVVVLGASSGIAADRASQARLHKNKIRSVAEANFGIAAEPPLPLRAPTGAVLH